MDETLPHLTPESREQFHRNMRLAEVGEVGQRRLLASRVMVVGAGGLGSAALLYLAAAGVGRLRIADPERLEASNLNRQVLYRRSDLGRPKAASARREIIALNPDCRVETVSERVTAANAKELVRATDLALDCTDNFEARFAVADACWSLGVPLVSAGVLRFGGQILSVVPAKGSPCLRCLMPEPPPAEASPKAAEVGILGAVAGMFGTLQAIEAVKILLGVGEDYAHRLLAYDGLAGTFRLIRRERDPACPLCGKK